jgi:CdiA C-terminal tRNase domain
VSYSTGTAEDWVDQYGRTYDAVGSTLSPEFFDQQWPNLQKEIVDHLDKAQFVPVDVARLTPAQIAEVKDFIVPLSPRVFTVGG